MMHKNSIHTINNISSTHLIQLIILINKRTKQNIIQTKSLSSFNNLLLKVLLVPLIHKTKLLLSLQQRNAHIGKESTYFLFALFCPYLQSSCHIAGIVYTIIQCPMSKQYKPKVILQKQSTFRPLIILDLHPLYHFHLVLLLMTVQPFYFIVQITCYLLVLFYTNVLMQVLVGQSQDSQP